LIYGRERDASLLWSLLSLIFNWYWGKGFYYSGIKIFNNLPPNIRNLSCDAKRFNSELGKYLYLKSFYTIEEYYNSRKS